MNIALAILIVLVGMPAYITAGLAFMDWALDRDPPWGMFLGLVGSTTTLLGAMAIMVGAFAIGAA